MAVHVRNGGEAQLAVRFDFLPVRHEELSLLLRMGRVEVRFVDYILTKLQDLVPDPLPCRSFSDLQTGLRTHTLTFSVFLDCVWTRPSDRGSA